MQSPSMRIKINYFFSFLYIEPIITPKIKKRMPQGMSKAITANMKATMPGRISMMLPDPIGKPEAIR